MSNILILRAPGTNCDQETAYAFQLAGAKNIEIAHINRVLENPRLMDRAKILCIPGGFSFGDDIAAGKIFATKISNHLIDTFQKFRDSGKLMLGICNGFQVLLKSGLIGNATQMTLTWNEHPRYTDRWVHLKTESTNCVFLQGIESMYLPIAHAEGRFLLKNTATNTTDLPTQFPLKYIDNPNGSTQNIAGACDTSGRVFGLMPHPERHIDPVQHPQWTRRSAAEGDGLAMFRNAVNYVS
ncbi:phosphoribosylformylglycinamidine synthase [Planctomycetales bacterium]|nr:phosphoribosylformylglycinamidine synthase [Planctomycetales bacterium]